MTYAETIDGPEVTSATLRGPRIDATLATPGSDWIRLGPDGIRRQDLRAQLLTVDGQLILFRYDLALIRSSERFLAALASGEATEFGDQYMRIALQFEVGAGRVRTAHREPVPRARPTHRPESDRIRALPGALDERQEKEDDMRVFVTGASGAVGTRLVPPLIDARHEVIGTHNRPASAELLRTLGATPVMVDLLDARAVRKAVLEHEPDAIVHEATALANAKFSRSMDKVLAKTSELRTTGTDALLAAAREAGVRRFVAQSFALNRYARAGGPVKIEDDPLDPAPPKNFQRTAAALTYLEQVVADFGGIALRYGVFYGAANDGSIEPVRKRQFPIIGDAGGIWSWIHLDDAAAATVLALEHEGPAVYNIVDDDPAPVREWLPVLAEALGAGPPRHLPTWLAQLLAGEAVVAMTTEARGASNAKAKRELGWTLRHPSWRQGFFEVYTKPAERG